MEYLLLKNNNTHNALLFLLFFLLLLSQGTLAVVALLQERFSAARLVSISGNVCSDKKPSAINWIEGRGKSVVVEAVIPGDVVEKTLKTTVAGVVDVAYRKDLVGSAMAGAVGGFNAHAASVSYDEKREYKNI